MQPDPTQTPAPTDAADAGAPPAPEPATPPPPAAERKGLASFEDALREHGAPARADVNGDDGSPKPAADDPDDAEPAAEASADVKATAEQQAGKPGRRARAAEENAQRIADLERQLAERDPEKLRADLRAELEAEQARRTEAEAAQAAATADAEEAAWYRSVRDVPDRNLSDEDYRRREEYKAKLDAYPEVVRKATSLARAEADAAKQAHEAEASAFWDGVYSRFGLLQTLEGVTRETLAEKDLYLVGQHLYETGATVREQKVRAELQPKLDKALDEVRRLKAEAAQFKVSGNGGLAAARAPLVGGGRSGASSPAAPDWKTAKGGDFFEAALRRESEDRP